MSRPSHMTDCEGAGAGVLDNEATMCRMCGRWFVGETVPAHWRLDIFAAHHQTLVVRHEHWMTQEDEEQASMIAARRRQP